ncbi:aggregation-promoting factor C-terminal-like domain-containing protein [Streptomyces sp. SGAir0957]
MPAISVGSVEVDVVPNTRGIHRKLTQDLVAAATQAGRSAGNAAGEAFGPAMTSSISDSIGERVGTQIGRQIAVRITGAIRDGIGDGIRQGGQAARPAATRQGADTGGAFARSLRTKLQEAFRSMPKLNVSLSDTGVDADLARLRARMETLSNKTIGIDVSAEAARAEAADIEERLRRLGTAHPNVTVRADTARAIAQLQAVQAQVDELTADPARIRVETDGQIGTRLRAAVQQAQASLPNVNIGADTSPAQAEIASLRARLAALSDQRIGIDISAGDAIAQISQIQARLARLSTEDADIAVRVDAGAASAQLAAFTAQVRALDGMTANVDVDTSKAVSGMSLLITTALAFGPTIIPALPIVAAGLGAIAAAGVAAGVGIASIGAVALPAIKDIGGALQAQKAAQDAATSATSNGAAANNRAASKALQMASAQQSLATARRNAARQIADAERAVGDAVRQAAQANAQAASQVKSARTSLADAYAQAADRMTQANEQVDQAERDLAQSQKSARQAQLDLTAARAEASRQLQDMNNQLADAQLSQRDAEIALKEAAIQRDKVLNSSASDLDKQKAVLQYDQAVQRLKEQRVETQRLQADTAKANKAGVDGSATVKAAQQQLASAQQDVVDKTAALKKAQDATAKTQIENTRAIADAQTKLSEAQKNVAETQRQGAESIARAQERVVQAQQSGADSITSAQRQIASASQQAAGGVDQAAAAQAKYQQALAKLTPSARGTFNAFVNLRTAFTAWSRSLQPQVMPLFTRAIDGLRRSLPGLTPFVTAAADAISGLQDRVSRGFKSPWWQEFKADLQGSVGPAITGLGISFGRIFKGMGGIIQAFLPHMDSISERMQRITGRFANWGTGLKGSPEFERFLSYSAEMGPKLAHALGQIGGAFMSISQALSPLSGPLLMLLGGMAEAINIIATHAPWMVQGIWLLIVAMRVWTIVQWALNLAMRANPIQLVITALIALVAFGIYAFNKFPWFRNLVLAAWNGIKTASLWLWEKVLKPVFTWIGDICVWLWSNVIKPYFGYVVAMWKRVASVATWLWQKVLSPVFHKIANIITWWWNNIVKPYFGYVKTAISVLGGVFRWLYDKVVKPVWKKIRDAISWAWEHVIRPVFNSLKSAVGKVADSFESARKMIKKAWDKLSGIAKTPVRFIINTVYNRGIVPVWNKIATAFGAKKINKMDISGWNTGGVLPGYTPGKDVHLAALSGGEAVMRPEWTRAVGPGYVNTMNAAARGGGVPGVQKALGLPAFKDGGIFSWVGKAKNKLAGWGSGAWDKVKAGAKWLKDTLADSARAGVRNVVNPLISKIPGLDNPFGRMAKGIPMRIVDAIFGYADKADARGASASSAGGGIWAKPVNVAYGTPFGQAGSMWSSGHHTGLDFPARTGTPIHAVAAGTVSSVGTGGPYGKHLTINHGGGLSSLYAHMSKILVGLNQAVSQGKTIGRVGATGNVTGPHLHLEARLNGRAVDPMRYLTGGGAGGGNVQAVGAAQKYAKSILSRYGWGPSQFGPLKQLWQHESGWRWNATNPSSGAYGIPQSLPASKMASAGSDWRTNAATQIRWGLGYIKGRPDYGSPARAWAKWQSRSPHWYDSGGYLPEGLSMVYNGTGKPEPVLTNTQWDTLARSGGASGPQRFEGDLYLDSGEFLGRVRGEAQSVVQESQARLVQRLRAR